MRVLGQQSGFAEADVRDSTSFQSLPLTKFSGFRSVFLEAEPETGIQNLLRKCSSEKPIGWSESG